MEYARIVREKIDSPGATPWHGRRTGATLLRQARISPSTWDVAFGVAGRKMAPASLVADTLSGEIAIGLLLLPGFELHDLSVLADCFELCNALAGMPKFVCRTVSISPMPVVSSVGTCISAHMQLESLNTHTNLVVLAGTDTSATETPKLFRWIAQRARLPVGLGAVGGGCRVLAASRVLHMKKAAIHWESFVVLRETYPDVEFMERLFATDDRIMTCSGRGATMDFALYCIAGACGAEMARAVADRLNYDQFREHNRKQARWTDAGKGKTPLALRRAIALMNENLEHPVSTSEVAKRIGTSPRHLQRIFLEYFRLTPSRFYQNHRLQCARRLIRQTCMTVTEVGMATGFKTTSHFSERYWRLFGTRPSRDRLCSGGAIGEQFSTWNSWTSTLAPPDMATTSPRLAPV
jgi:AraC family carnitine catabolism transcriptional activator